MKLAPVAGALILGLLLAGCSSSGARIAPRAVEEAAAVFGGSGRTLELTGDDITRLATKGAVTDDVIRSMAPKADTQPLWRRSLGAAQTVNEQTKGPVRDIALGVACDAVDGKIHNADEVRTSLRGQIEGLSDQKLESVVQATMTMWKDLYEARTSTDPNERSAAVLTCFTLQSVS